MQISLAPIVAFFPYIGVLYIEEMILCDLGRRKINKHIGSQIQLISIGIDRIISDTANPNTLNVTLHTRCWLTRAVCDPNFHNSYISKPLFLY